MNLLETEVVHHVTYLAVGAFLLCCESAHSADTLSATLFADRILDKAQYTISKPTPTDKMRDMDTDRPNKTNSPHTIDAGHLQIEAGAIDYVYYRDRSAGANSRSESATLSQINFRLGVLNKLELNASLNSYVFQRNTDYVENQSTRNSGLGDIFVGTKLNFWGNETGDRNWATALGIQPQFKIATASSDIGNAHPELFVGVPFLMNLPAGIHLGLQTLVSWERSNDNTSDVTGWQNSLSIDRAFFGQWDIFVEYWSHVSTERHQFAQQTFDAGFTYPISDNLSLDTGVNVGLNQATNTVEWLAGVSIRI